MLLTILTPTFNRSHTLMELFGSLERQTNKNFQWVIVDDGSTDDTKELIDKIKENTSIPIHYYIKTNGGKHTALNMGIRIIDTELTFIVDSDDRLTEDAIQSIHDSWISIKEKNICGVCFLKGFDKDIVIGDSFPKDYAFDNYINLRINRNIKGDKAEVWRTSLLKQIPWPEFKNEKFIAEGYVWNLLAKDYDMLFINKIIYIANYLEDGLTKSGRKLRIQSPLGGMINSKVFLSKEYNLRTKTEKMLLYIAYGFFSKKSIKFMFNDIEIKLFFIINLPLGYILYKYWDGKYLK